jgi:hypothetical protein
MILTGCHALISTQFSARHGGALPSSVILGKVGKRVD